MIKKMKSDEEKNSKIQKHHDDITAVVSLLSTFKVRFSLFKINIWNPGESVRSVIAATVIDQWSTVELEPFVRMDFLSTFFNGSGDAHFLSVCVDDNI